MSLRKSQTETKTQPPVFESEDDTFMETVEEGRGAEQDNSAPVPAVAKPANIAAPASKFRAALQEYKNALGMDIISQLGYGVLPKIVADRAGFETELSGKKVELGDWIDFKIVSYNDRWLISAGVEGDGGKDMLRTSYDGETLENDGGSVHDYIQDLKEQGFHKAGSRKYVDVYGFVVNSQKKGETPEEDLEMIQLQLSPQSVKAFTGFQVKLGVQASITKSSVSDVVRCTIEKREYNGNKYASISFSAS